MKPPLRVAVIGLGAVAATRHMPVLTNHPHFEITRAAEISPPRAQEIAARFSIANITHDPFAALAANDVDVVAILTPPSTHAALANAALDAGKHVFIEKPFTLDVAEGENLLAHAERANCKLLVGFNLRHHVQMQNARAFLRAGHLGKVRAVVTLLGNTHARRDQSAWHHDLARGGDPFFELGVHHFDALRFLLDAEPVTVHAQELIAANGAATLATQLQFANAVLATTLLAEDTLDHNTFEIIGERGRLLLSLYRFDGLRFLPRGAFDGDVARRLQELGDTLAKLPSAFSRMRRGGEYVLTYRAEWDHFAEVIQQGRAPLASARDGLAATRIAHAARQAVWERVPVAFR